MFQAGGHAADGVELRLNMEIGQMGDTETPRRSGSDGGQRGQGRAGREAAREKVPAGDVHGAQYTGHLAQRLRSLRASAVRDDCRNGI